MKEVRLALKNDSDKDFLGEGNLFLKLYTNCWEQSNMISGGEVGKATGGKIRKWIRKVDLDGKFKLFIFERFKMRKINTGRTIKFSVSSLGFCSKIIQKFFLKKESKYIF